MVIPMMSMMKGKAYQLSLDAVKSNPEVISLVGENPKPGYFILGEISYSGVGGTANLNYSIEGSKSEAEVYVYATNLEEQWELKELLVVGKDSGQKIVILTQEK